MVKDSIFQSPKLDIKRLKEKIAPSSVRQDPRQFGSSGRMDKSLIDLVKMCDRTIKRTQNSISQKKQLDLDQSGAKRVALRDQPQNQNSTFLDDQSSIQVSSFNHQDVHLLDAQSNDNDENIENS